MSNLCQPLLICSSRRDQGLRGSEPRGWLYQHHVPAQQPTSVWSYTQRPLTLTLPERVLKPLCLLRAWKGSPWVEEASANRNLQWSKEPTWDCSRELVTNVPAKRFDCLLLSNCHRYQDLLGEGKVLCHQFHMLPITMSSAQGSLGTRPHCSGQGTERP